MSAGQPGQTAEQAALLTIFDDGDLDLGVLMQLAAEPPAEQDEPGLGGSPMSDDELETLMREHWGLQTLDVSRAVKDADAGNSAVRADEKAEDDFTDEEWQIVRSLQTHCRKVIAQTTTARARRKEIDWCFMRGTEDSHGVSFHLACESLMCRPLVVQTLIQHYWFQRNIIIPDPLQFLADPLPDALQTEALFHAGVDGLHIATRAWAHPSRSGAELMAACLPHMEDKQARYDEAFIRLEKAGLVMLAVDRVYFTSRKPSFRKFRRESWSRSFVTDDY